MKLFVGNLADTVDSTKLKQVFQQFTKVTECDVVKNYAFVVGSCFFLIFILSKGKGRLGGGAAPLAFHFHLGR